MRGVFIHVITATRNLVVFALRCKSYRTSDHVSRIQYDVRKKRHQVKGFPA